jgi:hypothetical protein
MPIDEKNISQKDENIPKENEEVHQHEGGA